MENFTESEILSSLLEGDKLTADVEEKYTCRQTNEPSMEVDVDGYENEGMLTQNAEELDMFDGYDSDIDPSYCPDLSDSSLSDAGMVSHNNHRINKAANRIAPVNSEGEVSGEAINEGTGFSTKPSPLKSRAKRKTRQLRKNTDQPYITESGKLKSGRQIRPLNDCRAKCKQRIPEAKRLLIFQEYWKLGDYNKRCSYVASLMSIDEVKTHRPRTDSPSKMKYRNITYKYYLDMDGKKEIICKRCFMSTLDETDNFIKTIACKKQSNTAGIISTDFRGTIPPPNKLSNDKLDQIRQHIRSFPSYESHYTRKRNDHKYLASHLILEKMYDLYKQSTEQPACKTIYSAEFHKMKLKFKKPSVDTCSTCDMNKMKISLSDNEVQKAALKEAAKLHHEAQERAYAEKRNDTARAKEDKSFLCLTFDLQQCLPTPSLETSVVFYKRQLWVFNLTIHTNADGQSTSYMWHEAISNRGANQIASCLYKYLTNLPSHVTHIVLYSDTCVGQNKNSHVASMFSKLLQDVPHIQKIDHKFMTPGHSFMEVDGDHAVIERKKKKTDIQIYHPHDWFQFVRSCGKRFIVVEMEQKDFLNFSSLLKGPLVLRNKDTNGDKFLWHNAPWFRYEKEFGMIAYKLSLKEEEPFKYLSLLRRGITSPDLTVQRVSNKLIPISMEKKKDLIDLLPYIVNTFHKFYLDLPASNQPDFDPDLIDIDVDN